MVPENGFQNHLQGRVREAYPLSMQQWSVVKQLDNKPRAVCSQGPPSTPAIYHRQATSHP